MQHNAAENGSKPAIIFEGERISWEELWEKVEASSGYFTGQLGDAEQKIVALILTNSIEFVVVYLAILHAGHIAMPLDPVYKPLEINAMIKRAGPDLIIIQERYRDKISTAQAPILLPSDIIEIRQPSDTALRLPPNEQVASLFFTSGTSGQPKVVPNTHANHIWNIKACSKVWEWTNNDTMLINLPLSHMHGLVMGLSGALYHGNTLYLRQQSFDAKAVLEELSSGRISLFTHAPVAYSEMLAQPGGYDLTKVRLMISGSAPFPPSLWQDFKDRFGVEVIETYGSSETGRIAANLLGHKLPGSAGKILPGVDMKLSRENEVLVKSPGVFPGYHKNQAATKANFTKDGYWRTGDIGELNDGFLILKGRDHERIRRYGYTVSPRDVEWALLENPDIKEVYVLGKPRPGAPDDELYYFIAGTITQEDLSSYCKTSLPFAWRPDHIIFVKSLPKASNGKPSVARLKALAVTAR